MKISIVWIATSPRGSIPSPPFWHSDPLWQRRVHHTGRPWGHRGHSGILVSICVFSPHYKTSGLDSIFIYAFHVIFIALPLHSHLAFVCLPLPLSSQSLRLNFHFSFGAFGPCSWLGRGRVRTRHFCSFTA